MLLSYVVPRGFGGGDQVVGVQAKFCYGRIRLFEMQSVVGRPLGLLLLVVKTCR
jgi:hypothetical protein